MNAGRKWPLIIIGLLVGNVIAVATLIIISSADASHYVVPDYYDKAVHHDDVMAQERHNIELGWSVELGLATGQHAGSVEVVISDRNGVPLSGATVHIIAYPRARAAQRLELKPSELTSGRYVAPARFFRAGLWQFEIAVTHGGKQFTQSSVLDIRGGR